MAAAGWTHEKRVEFERAFYTFLNHCFIQSKDTGRTCLGKVLFDGQVKLLNEIFDGLERGVHRFYCLKSRQLGISTIVRALITFYLGMHNGLRGSVVFDSDENKSNARTEIEDMIDNLPKRLKFPEIKSRNRRGLTLSNGSVLLFLSAGIKKTKTSGTLGRSYGLSLSHMSELCSYDNDEGIEAYENALSDVNPDRLYIYESTARGFNKWKEIWEEARGDLNHSCCVFLGWWSKPSQHISRDDLDWERYGEQPPTDREIKKIKEVKDRYGHQITPEQLAWVRRKMDPNARQEGDSATEYEGNTIRLQEQPWTEDDAFQMTGSVFFPPETLTDMANAHVIKKFKTFMFAPGIEFQDCTVHPAPNNRSIELKIWEDPDPDGIYVIAADVAGGHDEHNDRSAIEILRCYADGCDQVAEYAWPLINTRQFAWVIAALCGYYAGDTGEVHLIIEINGPGESVWNEITALKRYVQGGYRPQLIAEKGLRNIFRNVRNYIYTRSDAMAPGRNWQWKTTGQLKTAIMHRLRDFVSNGTLHIRSQDTLEEMRWVAQEGDSIAAQGTKKDDRVIAMAMGLRMWEERVRNQLSRARRTRDVELARRRLTLEDQVKMFASFQLEQFFAVKKAQRVSQMRALRRGQWQARR